MAAERHIQLGSIAKCGMNSDRVGVDADHSDQSIQGRHFPAEVIVLCVRWYLQYPLDYEHIGTKHRWMRKGRRIVAIEILDEQDAGGFQRGRL